MRMHTSETLVPEDILEGERRKKSIYLNDFYDAIKRIKRASDFHSQTCILYSRAHVDDDRQISGFECMHNKCYMNAFETGVKI